LGTAASRQAVASKTLSRSEIVQGVKRNSKLIAPCLKTARSNGQLLPGRYTFVLDWTIKPDGSVEKARLRGPANVLQTSLVACFEKAMKKWRFPASRHGAPISNFPFGPVNVR
jgi:hypothetical protein